MPVELVKTVVTGSVHFADGAPAASAAVHAGAFGSGQTGANGGFQLSCQVLPGRRVKASARVESRGRCYVGHSASAVVVADGVTALGSIVLEPEAFRLSAPVYPTGNVPSLVAAGDFDGDGVQDLASTSLEATARVSILLGNDDGTFGAPSHFVTGGQYGRALTVGDWDGDQVLDLAVVHDPETGSSSVPGSLSLLFGLGDGTFAALAPQPTGGSYSLSVASADLDLDGDLDLIVGQSLGTAVASVLLGHGDGTFDPPGHYATSSFTFSNPSTLFLTTADVNGDAYPDLLACGSQKCLNAFAHKGNVVSAMLGNGDGSFGSPIELATAYASDWVIGRDLNGDGALDLVVGGAAFPFNPFQFCLQQGGYQVFLGSGTGSFSLLSSVPFPCASASLMDLDQDLDLDLVVAQERGTLVLGGNGDGTFNSPSTSVAGSGRTITTADLRGDGSLELLQATGNGVLVLASDDQGGLDGAGPLELSLSSTLLFALDGVLGDFDEDGVTDLLGLHSEIPLGGWAGLYFHRGQGDGTFAPATTNGVSVTDTLASAVADLNGDGHLDLVHLYSGDFALFLGNGDGTMASPQYTSLPANPRAMTVTDLDADGDLDIVLAFQSGTLAFHRNHGNGTFAAPLSLATPGTDLTAVAAADLNGDTKIDFVALDGTSGLAFVFLGNGAGASLLPPYALGGRPGALALADLDGDGAMDLLGADRHDGLLRHALGHGDGTFAPSASQPFTQASLPSDAGKSVALVSADLDGDGSPDAIVRHNQAVAVLLGDGLGAFHPAQDHASGGNSMLAVDDLDGDGDLDLVTIGLGGFILLWNPRVP